MALKISNRFTIAIHMLALADRLADSDEWVCTSALMASSVNTNPVVIRRIAGMLKKAGILTVRAGTGGAFPARDLAAITLLDVYRAVGAVEDMGLFNTHEHPNPKCPVGANIQAALADRLHQAQKALEEQLGRTTVAEVVRDIARAIADSDLPGPGNSKAGKGNDATG